MALIFSHDGIKDSLTQLAAPPLFYEELRRELSRFERSGNPFSLVRLVLLTETKNQYRQENNDVSIYEVEILNFAEILIRLSRSEDLCARIGERESAATTIGKIILIRIVNPLEVSEFISVISKYSSTNKEPRKVKMKTLCAFLNFSSNHFSIVTFLGYMHIPVSGSKNISLLLLSHPLFLV